MSNFQTLSNSRILGFSRRVALLGGINAGALLIGLSSISQPASADPLSQVLISTDGSPGHAGWTDSFASGPGNPGISRTITLSTSYTAGATGPAVEIGSVGGNGGKGDNCCFATLIAGGNGGSGGNLTLLQTGSLTGTGDQPDASSADNPLKARVGLLKVYSYGGNGGPGGLGGGGGAGGTVSVTLGTSLIAAGSNFAGILAQSLGGDAGKDGVNQDQIFSNAGGAGGTVSVTLNTGSTVSTAGNSSPGVIAQSIGGVGTMSGTTKGSGDYVSQGGAGGAVSFTSDGSIKTSGASSLGVILQSVGGGGGNEPMSGGNPGGAGGMAGAIGASHTGTISTTGDYSIGLFAQSVGGTGGTGGAGIFGGGDGGAAGAGGTITLVNTGTIRTEGQASYALFAQSIGGGNADDSYRSGPIPISPAPGTGSGGGAGGNGLLFFSSGGAGGTGGNGGSVSMTNGGALSTTGDEAYGMLAQSVGGGGGVGGDAFSIGLFTNSSGPVIGAALGGSGTDSGTGGGGGNGGTVTIKGSSSSASGISPSITTSGDAASAILAQSIGGSGGTGGTARAYTVGVVAAYASSIGGQGGAGGNGGSVTIDNTSVITTSGIESYGIQALSVGGGGGSGGAAFAYAMAVSPPDAPGASLSYAVGGSGGAGGIAGPVTVVNDAIIVTTGMASSGIQAISVGGGGGTGSMASAISNTLSYQPSMNISIAIGGDGSGGGAGSTVNITNNSSIETSGHFAQGIVALSIGGGGGAAGSASTTTSTGTSWDDQMDDFTSNLPTGDSIGITLTVGGNAGGGGSGGAVTVDNTKTLLTHGMNAAGILAQSIGGGGGVGGGYLTNNSATAAFSLSIGGTGGVGGSGGTVSVTNRANAGIATDRSGSFGIIAQSVGGGGGLGGSFTGSVKAPVSYGDDPLNFIFALTGELLKSDKVASSLFGDPKKKEAEATFLDKNSTQQEKLAAAKDILGFIKTLTSDGSFFENLADASLDILWDQLGDQIKDQLKEAGFESQKLPNVALAFGVGGSGGGGGSGGPVGIQNDGTITTRGDNAYGIFAQSVGGGGGIGGSGMALGNNNINVDFTVGGTGGAGGNGGTVIARNTGDILTEGGGSYGLFAQSVGGGGGLGGSASSANTISMSATVALGGRGGVSSDGGSVTVNNSGTIRTQGYQSHALVAQSVGGGGGAAFMSLTDVFDPYALATSALEGQAMQDALTILAALGITKSGNAQDTPSTILPSPSANLRIGGSGVAGGSGGGVTVNHSGTIATLGDAAFGIFAQSIGGGGGFAGDTGGSGLLSIAANIGGAGGVAGNGGTVAVNFGPNGRITTSGNGATAVFLQSIGGGGGYGGAGGFSAPYDIHGGFVSDGGSNGNGGAITVGMTGSDALLNIKTHGAQAHGIFAQSLGGGGGSIYDMNGALLPLQSAQSGRQNALGTGGAVTINTAGAIEALGANSYGIFVQSGVQKADGTLDPTRTGGVVSISHSGTLTGGSGSGAAIRIDGGAPLSAGGNTISFASGSTVSALSGQAILSSFGTDLVQNAGKVIGDVNLAVGSSTEFNQFSNLAGGIYRTAGTGTVNLGANGAFANNGTFDIGGVGTFATANLTGLFQQGAGGTFLVDVTSTPTSGKPTNDVLNVTGGARLGGVLQANVEGGLLPGSSFVVLNASGPITGGFSVTNAAAGSPFAWTAVNGGTTVVIVPNANFVTPTGMVASASELSHMSYLQGIWNNGGRDTDNATLFGNYARSASPQSYMSAVDSFVPEESSSVGANQTSNTLVSMTAAMSCPMFVGTGTLLEETNCAWARIIGNWVDRTTSNVADGYNGSSVTYRVGVQREVVSDWFVGATAGFTQSWLTDSNGFSSTEGNSADAAIALKHQIGPWLFAASGHLGFGSYDTDRTLTVGPAVWTASGTSSVLTAAARLRASYEFAFPTWYVRPFADVNFLYTYMPSSTEQGVGGPGLQMSSVDQFNIALSPNLEIGARLDLDPQTWLRPYASVGMTYFTTDSMAMNVQLTSLSAPPENFVTQIVLPQTLLNLGAGLQLVSAKGYELRAEYKADIGNDYLAQELSARFAVPF
ncbi:autotransporter outer membrane beta-barrel domain-containing protein [Aquabacter sp. CN5-332]|uniref:autotransporter outer membrane beta-barrel domain-containing protein n=1 Tax=Aquabacter sp. CN5-332 TaxID=3156608 RepID=UPI0032B4A7CC